MSVAAKVAGAVAGLRVSEAPVDRLAYGRDLWPRHHLAVRSGHVVEGTRPATIVWPTTTEQVAQVVRLCHDEGVSLVPFGAGSGVCGGVLPDASTLVLDLKRMGAIRRLDREAPDLTVEAGALGITLEEELQRQGWTIGHFPSSILCSTVGGWLAARGAGQCSGKYGKIEDMVASIELVDGRGEVATLRRRPWGVDLTPLIIGSEGTLGVITACTLRLHENPTTRAYLAFSFADIEPGWEALRALYQAGLRPAVSRLYDPFDSLLAKQGSVRSADKPRGATSGGHPVLGKLLRAPSWLNGAVDALGSRVMGGSTLILIFEGSGEGPHDDARRATELAERLGGRALGEGPARKWWEHRYSVSYRQSAVFRSGAFSDTFEVAAPWSRLRALYDGVRRALSPSVFVMAHLSHAYPDGCSIYFSFAGAASSDDEALRVYDATWAAAMAAALEAGGTISHHHGVGRSKAPRMGDELGAGVDVVRSLMRAFDPAGVMNPGNLLPRPGGSALRLPEAPEGFWLDAASRLATLPGEMSLGEASVRLSAAGMRLPGADAARAETTVGAWIEAGMAGSPDPWGDPVDHRIAGLRAALPSGRELRVRPGPRRAVGPDLVSLFLGMRGRYGCVLGADVRVEPEAAARPPELPYRSERAPPLTAGEERLLAHLDVTLGQAVSAR